MQNWPFADFVSSEVFFQICYQHKYASTAVGKLLYITCQELNIGMELNHLWIGVETVIMCFKQRAVH